MARARAVFETQVTSQGAVTGWDRCLRVDHGERRFKAKVGLERYRVEVTHGARLWENKQRPHGYDDISVQMLPVSSRDRISLAKKTGDRAGPPEHLF